MFHADRCRLGLRIHALVLLVGLSVAAACGGDEGQLHVLLEDPMSSVELEGARLDTTSKVEAAVLPLPSPARIQMRYVLENDASADDVVSQAVTKARKAGWVVPDPVDRKVQGSKVVASGRATIDVFVDQAAIPPRLVVLLELGWSAPPISQPAAPPAT